MAEKKKISVRKQNVATELIILPKWKKGVFKKKKMKSAKALIITARPKKKRKNSPC